MGQQTTRRAPGLRFDESNKIRLMGVALALLGAAYTVVAVQYGIGVGGGAVEAGALPFALGILLTLLSAMLALAPGTSGASEPKPQERRRQFLEARRFFAAIVGYAAVVTLIGFVLGTAIGVMLLLRYIFQYAWPRAVIAGVVMAGCGYLIFDVVLAVQLP